MARCPQDYQLVDETFSQFKTRVGETSITLSIEPTGGKSFQHGFHLGTDERLARQIAEGMFAGRNNRGEWTCTVALVRDNRILAVYDGSWDREIA